MQALSEMAFTAQVSTYLWAVTMVPGSTVVCDIFFFFSSRRRHTRFDCDWSSDVCSSDLLAAKGGVVQINYHSGFLSQEFLNAEVANPEINKAMAAEVQKRCGDDEACQLDRKSTRLNSSHSQISYAVFCLKKKKFTRVVARSAIASAIHYPSTC